MDNGKYRWMTIEEAECEVKPHEFVWWKYVDNDELICSRLGTIPWTARADVGPVCRALVPEAPTVPK